MSRTRTAVFVVLPLLVAAIAPPAAGLADEDKTTARHSRLDDITVTATRHDAAVFDVPWAATVLGGRDLRRRLAVRTMPESLYEVPSVLVQKTSHGQGSPYIRGFTGFQSLFLVDGIRLNNGVFRSGPNQYWNTVDPQSLARLEVVRGSGSVLYGSDAAGGTVQAFSRGADLHAEGWRTRNYFRAASAERSQVERLEVSGRLGDSAGLFLGGTFKNFGSLRAGAGTGTLHHSGYEEVDTDARLDWLLAPELRLVAAFQHVDQDRVPRTHKTVFGKSFKGTRAGSELERVLDQTRDLAYLQLHHEAPAGFYDRARYSLSWHRQREAQFRVKSSGKSDRQGFDVTTLGIWAQFENETPIGVLTYGAERYEDEVDSFKRKFKADGSFDKDEIQGPVGDDAGYDLTAFYVQDEAPLSDALALNGGLRWTRARASAGKVKGAKTGAPISVSGDWDNLVGSLRLLARHGEHLRSYYGVSQAFRAPNLSDLTGELDTSAAESPAPGVQPEFFTTWEAGAKLRTPRLSGQLAYWYTRVRDMIVQSPTGSFNASGTPEVSKDNFGDGFVHGVELEASWSLDHPWRLWTALSWMDGDVKQYDAAAGKLVDAPLSRLMPATAVIGLRIEPENAGWWAEAFVRAAARADKLALRDITDTQRIPPGGTPGYAVIGLRGGASWGERLSLSLVLENLADKDYRVHGSGQNEPGFNMVVAMEARF